MATVKNFFSSAYSMFKPVTHIASAPAATPAAAPAAAPTPAPNPLDEMRALWKNDPNKPTPADPLRGPILNPDTSKIAEAAGKMNFMDRMPAELMARVQAGNDPAALVELINTVAQQTLATSAQIGAATVENGLQRQTQRIEAALPGRIKQAQLEYVPVENAALAHEASQPMLRMVRAQIQAQNPNLSPEAINKQAESILIRHANAVSGVEDAGFREGGMPRNQQGASQSGTDWEAWANT